MNKGFIFYAVGDKYKEQFRKSATLLKENNPDINITVFTDRDSDKLELANNIEIRSLISFNTVSIFRDIVASMKETSYDKTILMDTDVINCGRVTDVFDILDKFDIAATHASYRLWPCDFDADIPEPFVQFNTGFLAYNSTDEFSNVLNETLRKHSILIENYNEGSEQPCFREAVYESNLMPYVLPSEYNFRSRFLSYAQLPIKNIHEETLIEKDLDTIRERIELVNERPYTPRAWVPNKGMVYDVTRREYV